MSCYLRHLKDVLEEANIAVMPENRKQVDEAIHQIVGVNYRDCPAAWKRLKHHIIYDERERRIFIKKLQDVVY